MNEEQGAVIPASADAVLTETSSGYWNLDFTSIVNTETLTGHW